MAINYEKEMARIQSEMKDIILVSLFPQTKTSGHPRTCSGDGVKIQIPRHSI